MKPSKSEIAQQKFDARKKMARLGISNQLSKMGVFSENSCVNKQTGHRKHKFKSATTANIEAEIRKQRTGVTFKSYACLYCDGFHLAAERNK